MMKFSPAQIVFVVCFLAALIVGVCVWLIADHLAPPTILTVPLGGLLTLAVHVLSRKLGFQEGLVEMPPQLQGATVETRIVKTLPPPPTAAELGGGESDTGRETPEAKKGTPT